MIIEKSGNFEDFFDDLSELKSKNKRNGVEKIIQCLNHYSSLRNSEIAKKTGMKPSSVTEALEKLEEKGLVSNKNGNFELKINEDIKKQIFNFAKINDFKIDELIAYLLKENKNNLSDGPKTSIIKILNDRERTNKIKAITDALSDKNDLYRTGDKKNPTYHISPACCNNLGLCYVCKTPIDDGTESCIINHTLQDGIFPYKLPLTMHATCIDESYSQEYEDEIGESNASPGFCKYCGLPLSAKELRNKLKKSSGHFTITKLMEYLSKKEKDAYQNHVYIEVIKEFKKACNIEINLSILTDSEFYSQDYSTRTTHKGVFLPWNNILKVEIPINEKLGKELILKNKDLTAFHVLGKGIVSFEDIDFNEDKPVVYLSIKNELHNLQLTTRSVLDELFELMKDGGYSGSVERIKELHNIVTDWEQQKNIQINEIIDPLFKDPISRIYEEIWSPIPTPYKKMSSIDNEIFFGTKNGHSSLGYGRIMIEDDKKFHPHCFHERKQNQELKGIEKLSTSKKKESKK